MSDKFRPEIALSVYFNDPLLTVLSLEIPHERQSATNGDVPPESNHDVSAGSKVGREPIPLSVYLVGDPAAIDAIGRAAMKRLEFGITLQAESGSSLGRTYALDGQDITLISTFSTGSQSTTGCYSYDDNGTLINRLGSVTTYTYIPPTEPPVDPPAIVE